MDKYRATTFHHSVAQLLFFTPRVRKDIQTAVVFLTSRVRIPYEGDWQKLRRVLKYIRSAIHMPLILRVDNLNIVKLWVDASYAMHPDCRNHTGAKMSLGWVSVSSMPKIQKLNSRRWTEAELIGLDDVLPEFLWSKYFIDAQGFEVAGAVMYQYNLRAMHLKNNG